MNVLLSAVTEDVPAASSNDARLLASQYEEEKAQLARQIHDGLAQQLTVASLELSLWEYEVAGGGAGAGETARTRIKNLSALVSSMVATARSISGGLRPRTLDSFGFVAALEGLVSRLGTRLGGACRLESKTESVDIATPHSIHLYRILESYFTAIQKAPAEGVVVEVERLQQVLQVRIFANPLPALPAETLARLRAFGGSSSLADGALSIRFPIS